MEIGDERIRIAEMLPGVVPFLLLEGEQREVEVEAVGECAGLPKVDGSGAID